MDRRGFLRSMIGGVAAAAAVRTWPFRVFSFPSDPKPFNLADLPPIPDEAFVDTPWQVYWRFESNLICSSPRSSVRITGLEIPTDEEIAEFA